MNNFLVNNVTCRLVDWYTGRYTVRAYRELMDTQKLSAQEIENYQDEKLQRLVRHAYGNVEYYHDLFDSLKLRPDDIKTVHDLEKLPVSSKRSYREHPDYPQSMLAANMSPEHSNISYSGGTTGEPLKFYNDAHNRSYTWAAYWRWFTWMGMEPNEKTVSFWGQPVKKSPRYGRLIHEAIRTVSNEKTVDAFDLKEADIPAIARAINRYHPSHLHGYAVSLSYFARVLSELNIRMVPLKAVSATATILKQDQRALLEAVFRCPVFDQYGCAECNSIAFECAAHNGMHIASEHCYVEFLRDSEDEVGRIVITNLDNLAMPIIRYENGDYGEPSNEVCACGRALPLMKSISGRTRDLIRTRSGVRIWEFYFTRLLEATGWYAGYDLGEYQFVQEDIDRFRWYIVLNRGPRPGREDIARMTKILEDKLESSDIQIIFVDRIEKERSGKFSYTRSAVNI